MENAANQKSANKWLSVPIIATITRLLCRELTLHNEYLRQENKSIRTVKRWTVFKAFLISKIATLGAGQQEYKRNEQNDLFLNTCFHVNPFCWITRDLFVIRDKERTRFTLLLTAALQYFRMWPCLALLWFVLNTIGSSPFGHHLIGSLRTYFDYYNNHRPHTSLDDRTPGEVYEESQRSLRSAPAAPPLREATGLNKALQLTP